MLALYQLGVWMYGLGLRLAALWNPKAKDWVNGRRGLLRQLQNIQSSGQKVVWMHCPSLGEFEQGRPILEAMRNRYPDRIYVLSFFSPSGFNAQRKYKGADYTLYMPLDTRRNARRFVQSLKPELTIFVKYDFWLNHLRNLKSVGSDVILVSGIFRQNQHFFGPLRSIGMAMLTQFDHFFVQDARSVELLRSIGFKNVTLSGDTRFDRVLQLAGNAEPIEQVKRFTKGKLTAIAGSTWPADESLLLPIINDPDVDIRWVVAPHEISEKHLHQLESQIRVPHIRYSMQTEDQDAEYKVMIIDNIGLLSRIYQYGQIAYIGGGFGKSIHNILEAATWGLPTIFGPRHEKFAEALDLIELGGAKTISNAEELQVLFNDWIVNPDERSRAGVISRQYVQKHAGATPLIMNWISERLPNSSAH